MSCSGPTIRPFDFGTVLFIHEKRTTKAALTQGVFTADIRWGLLYAERWAAGRLVYATSNPHTHFTEVQRG